MEAVVKSALKHVPDENARHGLYRDVMPALENQDWNDHPDHKKTTLENKFNSDKSKLDQQLSAGKITEEEFRSKLDALEFDRDYTMGESSLKYAYQWYKDTYELFSPPESKWVRLAREKAPLTLEKWKTELRSQKIPFEDYMFE